MFIVTLYLPLGSPITEWTHCSIFKQRNIKNKHAKLQASNMDEAHKFQKTRGTEQCTLGDYTDMKFTSAAIQGIRKMGLEGVTEGP